MEGKIKKTIPIYYVFQIIYPLIVKSALDSRDLKGRNMSIVYKRIVLLKQAY